MMFLELSNFAADPENYYLIGSIEGAVQLDVLIAGRSKTGDQFLKDIPHKEEALLQHISALSPKAPSTMKSVQNSFKNLSDLFDYCDSVVLAKTVNIDLANDRATIVDLKVVQLLSGEPVSTDYSYIFPTAANFQENQQYVLGLINTQSDKTIAAREGAIISREDTNAWNAVMKEAEKCGVTLD